MELICANESNIELGYLPEAADIDINIGTDNDFELTMPSSCNILGDGFRFYDVAGNEYGGIVKKIISDTGAETVKYCGLTWRGKLSKYIICPDSGADYKTISGNVGDILSGFISSFDIGDLFTAVADSTTISNFQFDRYCSLLDGLEKMLKSVGRKLKIAYNAAAGKVELSSTLINDFSSKIELSQDGQIAMKITDDKGLCNHLVCLGKGDLKDREVINLYADSDGNISTTQTFKGIDEVTEVYDANNSDDLEGDGRKHFAELRAPTAIDVTLQNIDVDLYDIIAGRDRITGITVNVAVTDKIISVQKGTEKISYKVG